MTLQWLGQEQVHLLAGHYYRARFLLPAPCPIPNTRLTQIKTLLNHLGSRTQSDWESWTVSKTTGPGWTVLKIPDPSYFDEFPPSPWPGNMREVPPALNPNGMCPVWTWAKAEQDVTVPIDDVRGVLGPLGGILLNFWDESSGQRIYDVPEVTSFAPSMSLLPGGSGVQVSPSTSLLPGGQVSPGLPPLPSNILPSGTPGGQTPPGQPVVTEKKTSPVIYVVAGALAIGALYLVTRVT